MKPKFAITVGDPNGIGPEIVLKSFLNNDFGKNADPVVFADPDILQFYIKLYGFDLKLDTLSNIDQYKFNIGTVPCYPLTPIPYLPHVGQIATEAGLHAFEYINQAIKYCNQGILNGIVTAPINKEALKLAKVPYLDHTEILTKLTTSNETMTLFVTRNLKIFFYSRHISFREISETLEINKIVATLEICVNHLKQLGIRDPHLVVAALNPHGGEHGMFGKEEIDFLLPAVEKAKSRRLNVSGPIPADSVFHFAKEGYYDAVLALYHDQGHIAAKTYDFYKTVSITTGLPYIRTSVDHGTAMDIAGKGIANEISLVEAFKCAVKYYW